MILPAAILSTGLSILFLVVLFRPLEKLFPAREGQKFLRPAFWTVTKPAANNSLATRDKVMVL